MAQEKAYQSGEDLYHENCLPVQERVGLDEVPLEDIDVNDECKECGGLIIERDDDPDDDEDEDEDEDND